HLGFSLAAVGMFIGLVLFVVTKKKNLGLAGTVIANPLSPSEKSRTIKIFTVSAIIIAAVVYFGLEYGFLTFDSFIATVGIFGLLIPTAYFVVMYRSKKTTETERSRILAYIPLFIAAVMFWSI